jgi:hypothetical protein
MNMERSRPGSDHQAGRLVDPARRAPVALDAVGLPPMATDTTSRGPLADRVLSERVRSVPPSGIRRFFDIAATMDDVISLGVGEPDFDTPRIIVEAGVESLREGRTHYTSNLGLSSSGGRCRAISMPAMACAMTPRPSC